LTYALTWALWIPLSVLRGAVPAALGFWAILIGSNVPSAVAIILTAVGFGKGATRRLLGQLLIWRVGWRWYLLLLGPTVLVIGSITLVAALRGGPTAALGMPLLSAIGFVAFMIFPGSALGEEVGWRGFALPRLQSNRTALSASLVLGFLHALWHLPLWLSGEPDHPLSLYPAFVIQFIAMAVIFTWLYNNTRGSLLLAVLFHAALNAPLTLVLLPLGIANWALPFWLMAGFSVLAAIIVVAVLGPSRLSRQPRPNPPGIPMETAADPAHFSGTTTQTRDEAS
jgi:membrane protease YdiL (CAAX protease family)